MLALFIMRWSPTTFPNLPEFWPQTNVLFFGEPMLGQGLILKAFTLLGVGYYQGYFGVLLVLFFLNFTTVAFYARQLGCSLVLSLAIALAASYFTYLLDYSGHLHLWCLFLLAVPCFETVKVIVGQRLNHVALVVTLAVAPLFSMTLAYFVLLYVLLACLMFPRFGVTLITRTVTSLGGLAFATLGLAVYGTYAYFLLAVRSSMPNEHAMSDFIAYSFSLGDTLSHLFLVGHFDGVAVEADKFPISSSIFLAIFLAAGLTFYRRIDFFRLSALIFIFTVIVLGPTIHIRNADVSNWVFRAFYYVPGFSTMRVPSRFLLLSGMIVFAAGTFVVAQLTRRTRFFGPGLALILLVGVVYQTSAHLMRSSFDDVGRGRIAAVAKLVAGKQNVVLAHFPITESTAASFSYLPFSIERKWRTVNGVASYFPPRFFLLRDLTYFCVNDSSRCAELFEDLAADGVNGFVVHSEFWDYYKTGMSVDEFVGICRRETTRIQGQDRCLLL